MNVSLRLLVLASMIQVSSLAAQMDLKIVDHTNINECQDEIAEAQRLYNATHKKLIAEDVRCSKFDHAVQYVKQGKAYIALIECCDMIVMSLFCNYAAPKYSHMVPLGLLGFNDKSFATIPLAHAFEMILCGLRRDKKSSGVCLSIAENSNEKLLWLLHSAHFTPDVLLNEIAPYPECSWYSLNWKDFTLQLSDDE